MEHTTVKTKQTKHMMKRLIGIGILFFVSLFSITSALALTIQEVDAQIEDACSATIRFDTDLMANGTVHYSQTRENPSLYTTQSNGTIGFFHIIQLDRLEPQTTYYYYVSAARTEQNNGQPVVTTAEKRNGDEMFTFATPSTTDMPCSASTQQSTTETAAENTSSGSSQTNTTNSTSSEATSNQTTTTDSSLSFTVDEPSNRSVTQKEDILNFTVSNMTSDAILRVYNNRDVGNTESVPIIFNDSAQRSYFQTNGSTTLSAGILLNPGDNILEFELTKNGSRSVVMREVYVDMTRPRVEFVLDKSYTNNETITVTGRVTEDAKLTLFVNNQSAQEFTIAEEENGDHEFARTVTLSATPDATETFNISLFAEDMNGNTYQSDIRRVIIDKEKPDINFTTEFDQPYHSFLVVVRGRTEPNSRITAFNLKDGTAYQEALEAYRSGEVKTIADLMNLETTGSTTETEMSISISTLIGGIDNRYTVEVDNNGKFSDNCIISTFRAENNCLAISLFPGENNLLFVVHDEAGNMQMIHRAIDFEAGDPNWRVKKPLTIIPNTIYLDEMIDSEFPASAYMELEWAGDPDKAPTGPNGARVDVSLDGGPDNAHNQYIKLPMQQKSYYDYQANPPKLYSFIDFTLHTDDEDSFVENLYDEPVSGLVSENTDLDEFEKYMELKLKLNIGYDMGELSVQSPKQQFVTVPFAVALPEDLSKYLSPEMIEATLKALDVMINITEHGRNISDTMTKASLVGCGASIISYSLFGTTELEKAIYWTCDRVLCPTVPSSCQAKVFNENTPSAQASEQATVQDQQFIELQRDGATTKYQALLDTGSEEFRRYSDECGPGTNAIFVPVDTSETNPDASVIGAGLQGLGAQSTNIVGEVECFSVDDVNNIDLSTFESEICWSPERDRPKCVFQGTAPDQKIYPTNDLFSSLWCQCYPGASANFQYLGRVFQSMKTCMIEAQNGEIRAATCRELFYQYLCDALTWLFRQIIDNVIFGAVEGSETGANDGKGGMQERAQHLQSSLSSRYEERFQQLAASGLSSSELQHKTCVSALSGDISLLMNDIQTALTETATVAPTATLYATSRLGGYNPINGRITLHYKIVTSIIPGSDLDAELVMRCDRSQPGGEYCPATVLEKPLTSHIGSYISKDNTIDVSIPIRMKDTKHWYNVVELKLTYSPDGDDEKTLTYAAQIHKKSQLLAQCSASLGGEISCSAIVGDEQGNGNVELKTTQGTDAGTRITPGQQNTNYYPLNPLMFLVKVDNNYEIPFYTGIQQIPPSRAGATCKMYEIPSKHDTVDANTSAASGLTQTYLLLFEKLGQKRQGQLEGSFRGEQTLPSGNDNYLIELEGDDDTDKLFLKYQGIETEGRQNVVANFYYDIVSDNARVTSDDIELSIDDDGHVLVSGEITDKDGLQENAVSVNAQKRSGSQSNSVSLGVSGGEQTVQLNNRRSLEPLFSSASVSGGEEYGLSIRVGDEILSDMYEVVISEQDGDLRYSVSELEQRGPVTCEAGAEEYLQCDMEQFANVPRGTNNYMIRLTRVVVNNAPQSGVLRVVKSTEPIVNEDDEVDVAQEQDKEIISLTVNQQDTTVYQTGTHQFTVNVYQDANGDGLGDTPILWNLENQQAQYSINLFDDSQDCGSRPIVDLVEPLSDYVRPDGFIAGATILDDCNSIERVKVTVDNSYGVEQCSCTILDMTGDTCDTTDRCTITPMPEFFNEGFGYYRFRISDFEPSETENDAEMRITFEVEDTEGKENTVSRSVLFNDAILEHEQTLANDMIISPSIHPDPSVCGANQQG
jgi:hypothetical protein